jgi:diaminopimelate epimerase
MRLFNSDGSEAEMCGNLTRCLAKYLYEEGICRKETMRIETLAGIIKPQIILNEAVIASVRVDMGEPKIKRGQIPVAGQAEEEAAAIPVTARGHTFTGRGISMGNPHFVIFADDLAVIDLAADGPAIEKHALFPARINVEFVQVVNRGKVRMRVWERGAGVTLACGTGACAAAAAGMLNGLTDEAVEVEVDGGSLFLEWPGKKGSIFMTGPAERVYSGEIIL